MNADTILNDARETGEDVVKTRRWLHAHAETGFDLTETVGFVKEKLNALGIECHDCGKSGVVATMGEGTPVFLLRADMDALPVKELADVDFICENGNMHACGHDMHTAILLGAAAILKKHEKDIKGTVKFMFQPAEETLSGAKNMIENGVLENPSVDCAMMLHVLGGFPIPAGTVIIPADGVGAPAADYFTINVQGKGCHGSTPHLGVDSITVAAHILLGLQEISARELGVSDDALLTIGLFHGGTAGNVIADTAVMQGTMRAFDDDTREMMKKRLEEIAENIGESYRAKVTVTFDSGCPTLENNGELATEIEKYAKEILGEDLVVNASSFGKEQKHRGGSEDFSYVSKKVPSVMLGIAAGEPEKGFKYNQHHPKVTFDESVMEKCSALIAFCAIKWLENNGKT